MENAAPSPPADSPETARRRFQARWVTHFFVLNGAIWVLTGILGWLGLGDYVGWPFVVTTVLLFVGIFVVRHFNRALNHQVRRDLAALGSSAGAEPVLTAVAPIVYPTPLPDSPETGRLRARQRRIQRVSYVVLAIWVICVVLLANDLAATYAFLVLLVSSALLVRRMFLITPVNSALEQRADRDLAAHRQALIAEAAKTVVAPVLYLRSFADDDRAGRRFGALTEEEQLAKALAWIGPLLAVGRPGERLPQVGAQRIYVADEHWQARVTELMTTATLVVLRTGSSEGFRWEVARALSTLTPDRLLLVADDRRELREVLDAIARMTGRPTLKVRLPGRSIGSVKGLVMFRSDWSPQPLRLCRGPFRVREADERLLGRFTLALRPLFDRCGVSYRLPRFSRLRIFFALYLVASAIAIGIAGYFD